jgi:hypothetical protein
MLRNESGAGSSGVTPRAVVLGLTLATALSATSAYSDFVVATTPLNGSLFPLGVVSAFFVFAIVINGPLWRLRPGWAFRSSELAVALSIVLVACSVASVGLMRYLPAALTAPYALAADDPEAIAALRRADLPTWATPLGDAARDPTSSATNDVVRGFVGRLVVDPDTFASRLSAVPWRAWSAPAIGWGLFFVSFFMASLALVVVFRRQWAANERLPFPLAEVYVALLEQPRPGSWLNETLRAPSFWWAAGAVFCVHAMNVLKQMYPSVSPGFPILWRLHALFADPPLSYMEWFAKQNTIYFTVIGMTYFVRSDVAFSLWGFFWITQACRIVMGFGGQEITSGMQADQLFGAMVPYGLWLTWLSRHRVAEAFRAALPDRLQWGRRGPLVASSDEVERDAPEWISTRAAARLALIGVAASWVWLAFAGMSPLYATLVLGQLLLAAIVMARIVAETGVPFVMLPLPVGRTPLYLSQALPIASALPSVRDAYFTNLLGSVLQMDTRTAMSSELSNAAQITGAAQSRRGGTGLVLALLASFVLSFIVSGAASLYVEYNYSVTADIYRDEPINLLGAQLSPHYGILEPTKTWSQAAPPPETHRPLVQVGIGGAVVLLCGLLRARFAAWPFHPIGFILSPFIASCWFSVFVGWLAKRIVVRLGGSAAFRKMRPLFIGLVMGEALAGAFWAMMNLAAALAGHEYISVRLLPQ